MERVSQLFSGTDWMDAYLVPWGINIVLAVATFIVGRWIARMITRGIRRVMERTGLDATLARFLGNIAYTALVGVVIIASLNQLGIDTTSILAVFAAAGLAVGLALKDSLSNFAAGVMLIFFKPFKAGDFVEAAGIAGVVEEIGVFNTTFRTPDNREIIVPNSQIYGGTIVNVTARETRRIDLVFGIGYGDSIEDAKRVLADAMASDSRILADPEPAVALIELADNSVNLAARPWVNTADYWAVRGDLMERVKSAFDRQGISIPFPQRDVHLYHSQEPVRTLTASA
ncbi:MAG: mechanosensitive ion channel [Nitrospirota bacterium]|nr:mechanosensitive ion channel [Nitrospirota bacterium]